MRISDIIEAQNWNGRISTSSTRVWFNAATEQAITTDDDGNHSVGVMKNPDLFRITPEDLQAAGIKPGEQVLDYDGRVLLAAMRKGWVRIYVDARSPDTASNIEGADWRMIRRALVWFSEQIGTPMRIVVVLRHGPADKDGTPIMLSDVEQIDAFIGKGRLPSQQPSNTQVKPTDSARHAFRKI